VVVHCLVELVHVHEHKIPQECHGAIPQSSVCAPSVILSIASLEFCISPVEYDVSFA
jgi:hypothetical protein